MKGVEYKECRDIDFSSAKSIKRKLDNKIKSTGKMESASTARTPSKIPKPTRKEADKLIKSLHKCGFRSILSVVPHIWMNLFLNPGAAFSHIFDCAEG